MVKRSDYYGVGVFDGYYIPQKFKDVPKTGGKRKQTLLWTCPYYAKWTDMLKRCYNNSYHKARPTYRGCVVCEEWLRFSNFKSWMEQQDWEGKQLDKDLFGNGKLYSPGTCTFLPTRINSFITDVSSTRGEWLTGVTLVQRVNKFRAYCRNPFTKKQEHLGYFESEEDAHAAWKKRKLELAELLAKELTDTRTVEALINRYKNTTGDV